MILRRDHIDGVLNRSTDAALTPDLLESALDSLDGRHRTQVSLIADGGAILSIGGGPDGFLVQYLLPGDEGAWTLIGDAAATEERDLVIGGQASPYPARWIVGRAAAAQAAHAFAGGGGRSPSLDWEPDF